MNIENAVKGDAAELAYLINLAGEGIPEYLWSDMAEAGESAMAVGAQRAAREEGGFSYRNARVIREAGELLGMIIDYQLDDPYSLAELDDYPEVVKPLVLLEAKVPGSWYINAIATRESARGRGVASKLMAEAEARAQAQGVAKASLIVASENSSAKALYCKLGYQVIDSLPVALYPGALHGGEWLLMVKSLGGGE
ncbi:GNAT family N-acetyltransferase [Halioxenophilus sp. WMMB6]|uniref:GNAT family N-acetyltransferase n=1 Tax=Halioxenophilus sp. WMMB6 TaxID=3073815 RepID=UPI00295F4B2D|nr:GNAT family N-acetyltransferase [Halioxenophilus sp. WMMB6]